MALPGKVIRLHERGQRIQYKVLMLMKLGNELGWVFELHAKLHRRRPGGHLSYRTFKPLSNRPAFSRSARFHPLLATHRVQQRRVRTAPRRCSRNAEPGMFATAPECECMPSTRRSGSRASWRGSSPQHPTLIDGDVDDHRALLP